ncbi:MAG TPA: copper homeostasis protein CutC [Flavipsychrobacter sp.]|nr:copper homeostasis protein CutC [Flavipsychrobacter sp.]
METTKKFTIEIATSDYATTAAAVKGGADRIELCANLAEGGTTPPYGTLVQCREDFAVQLYPIIRPRGGDFLYTDEEFACMMKDIEMCKHLGCDGVVIGILSSNGDIDIPRNARLVELAYPLRVTFHRAFDRCREPFEALEQLVQLGCERILTSGLQPLVTDGIELISQLNATAGDRIIIMPGSGIRKENIKTVEAVTKCREFHASLRSTIPSAMNYKNPYFRDSKESYTNNFIDSEAVKALRNALLLEQ